MARYRFCLAVTFVALVGCRGKSASFIGHNVGETYSQFAAIEHPSLEMPSTDSFTGTVHCFETKDLGDHCYGQRHGFDNAILQFDNAHFTFVDGKLTKIATVGAGGIIGHPKQNWNWNLYLSSLKKQYGEPTTITVNDAAWVKGDSVVHAYLTVEPMPFNPGQESQTEHIELIRRADYKS